MTPAFDRTFGYVCLAAAVALTAWGFSSELRYTDVQFSDVGFHVSILHGLDKAVRGGQSPFDFWHDGVPYGFALFRAYQNLPYLVMYVVYRVCAGCFDLAQVVAGFTFLLAVLLPVSMYSALRICRMSVVSSGVAALLAVLIADGAEYGMGMQNFTFGTNGIITQLWAMVFLFPAVAGAYTYIDRGERLGTSVMLVFLAFGCHVVGGVILGISIGVFSLAALLRGRSMQTVRRAVMLVVLMAVVTAYQWIYVLADSRYINKSALEPKWKYEGRGIRYLTDLLWNGGFIDNGRLPLLTALLLIALVYVAVYRRSIRERAEGGFVVLSAFLFGLFFTFCAGREIWGWLFDPLPVMSSLHVHRLALAAHFFGIVVMSSFAGTVFGLAARGRYQRVVCLLLFAAIFAPAVRERFRMYELSGTRHEIAAREIANDSDLQQLLAAVQQGPYGWTYIGSKSTWQSKLIVASYIPLDLPLSMRGLPVVGGILYHAFALAGETIFDIDPNRHAHLDLFGIRNVIAPSDWKVTGDFSLAAKFGRFALWSRGSRMLTVADDSFQENSDWRGRTDLVRHFVQKFSGVSDPPGRLENQDMANPWNFGGKVTMHRPGRVVAAIGYHPNWRVLVDGNPAATAWVLPGLTSVLVPQGEHDIDFRYVGSSSKKYLFALALLVIIAVGGKDRLVPFLLSVGLSPKR